MMPTLRQEKIAKLTHDPAFPEQVLEAAITTMKAKASRG
jgi:hypothetical protein